MSRFQPVTKVIKKYGYYHILVTFIHLLSIVSLILLDFKYLIYGFLVFMVVMPLLLLIMHEYVSHESIVPRNRIIDLFLLLLFYCHDQTVIGKRKYHITHHLYYLDPNKDPTQLKISAAGNLWKYVFNLQNPVVQNLVDIKNDLYETNQWVKILEPHGMKIAWAYRILMFVFLPVEWFVSIVLYFQWLNLVIFNFHDVFFHGFIRGKDNSWFLPIWSNQAWHLRHHENADELYFGDGVWKWLNPAWYYYLLFFVPGPGYRPTTDAA